MCKDLKLNVDIAKIAWVLSVDALLTTVYLEFPNHIVATACLHLAGKITKNVPMISYTRYHTSRHKMNQCLVRLCDLYLHRDYGVLELKNIGSMNIMPKDDVIPLDYDKNVKRKLLEVRNNSTNDLKKAVNKNESGLWKNGVKMNVESDRPVTIRDAKISSKGSVRYVLKWNRDSNSGELLNNNAENDADISG